MATENFYYTEGATTVQNFVQDITKEITDKSGIYKWNLVYPTTLENIKNKAIISTTTTYNKTFYMQIERPVNVDGTKPLNYVEMCIGTKLRGKEPTLRVQIIDTTSTKEYELLEELKEDKIDRTSVFFDKSNMKDITIKLLKKGLKSIKMDSKTLVENTDYTRNKDVVYLKTDLFKEMEEGIIKEVIFDFESIGKEFEAYSHSVPSKFSWYRDITSITQEWMIPIHYWMNQTKNSINLVLRGEPGIDNDKYSNFLISYAHVGAIMPIEDSATTDDIGNFGITVSSNIEPEYNQVYGLKTGTGVKEFVMVTNTVGLPYQAHYPSFNTTNPFMDRCTVEGSRWNHRKRQFSEVIIVHPVDGERGIMENVLVGDNSSVQDLDRLVLNKDKENEENYIKFKVNAPYNFLQNSANQLYCIALRCYKTTA